MANQYDKTSLRRRVREFVLARGVVDVSGVLAALGRYVGGPPAVACGRRTTRYDARRHDWYRGEDGERRLAARLADLDRMLAVGRRQLLAEALVGLARAGQLRRVSPGVYGPPLPRLHDPGDPAAEAPPAGQAEAS